MIFMKKVNLLFVTALIAFLMITSDSISQENKYGINTLRLEARADFNYFNYDGGYSNEPYSTSGFDGKYLNFEIKGEFLEKFSYRYRQRMNIANSLGSKTFYQGTDWLALTYNATKNFSITSGKLCIGIGGWEYDLPPIDVYYASLFWDNVNCYDIGAQLNFTTNNKKHTISFQVTNSPFAYGKFENIYAYNLMWFGNMGFFRTSYSFNMIEQEKNQFINYIALGNAFDFERFNCYFDFMNRGFFGDENFLFGDFTVIGEIKYTLNEKFKIFAKAGYDINKNTPISTEHMAIPERFDMYVLPGSEYTFSGLGFEAFPYKGNQDIRLHAFAMINSMNKKNMNVNPDNNTPFIESEHELGFQFNIGLTWRVNFVK